MKIGNLWRKVKFAKSREFSKIRIVSEIIYEKQGLK